VITWLAPEDNASFSPDEALAECLALVQTSFNFRGYGLQGDFGEAAGKVGRSAFRIGVTGALIYLSDDNPAPARITISGERSDAAFVITLRLEPGEGEAGFATAPTYRPLTFGDVQALCQSESIELQRNGSVLRLSLPWVNASA
jgi:hypothetical protein